MQQGPTPTKGNKKGNKVSTWLATKIIPIYRDACNRCQKALKGWMEEKN
jgi:hypothetical protein